MADVKFKSILDAVTQIDKALKGVEKTLNRLDKSVSTDKGVQNLTKAGNELNTVNTGLIQTEKQLNKVRTQASSINKKAEREADKITQSLNVELRTKQELNKLRKKEITDQAKLNAELKANSKIQVKSVSDLKKKQAVLKKYVLTLDKAGKEYKQLTRQIKRNDAQLKKHNKSIRKSGGLFNSLAGRAAGFVGIYGVFRLLGNTLKVFKSFEKANKRLQAILGATAKQVETLSNQAKELGASTAFTASEVTGLQTELAKLGFTLVQIEAATEGILNLAAATGTDLAESATLAGAAVRIFGLSAEETGRVTDVLALATSKSALDMQKLATALPIVGTTAKQAGLNIEQTTALLGTLADRGIDASTAGTSLRMIFIQLAKKGITFNEAMLKINSSTNKTKTAVELFGARAATAATVLSETADATANLTTELNNAKGAAEEMAEVMLDNLAGDITKAQSAWEGFVLSVESGDGIISKAIRNVIQSLTFLLQKLSELNNFGNIIGETDAKIVKQNIEKFKTEAQYLSEGQKVRKLKGHLLFLEEQILKAEQEKTLLPKTFLGFKSKEARLINARIKAYEREKQILIDLNKTGFFTGKENITLLEDETKAVDDNTTALKKNLEEVKKLKKEKATKLGQQTFGTAVSPDAPQVPGQLSAANENQIANALFAASKSIADQTKTKTQSYFNQLFKGEGSFLSRLFGGGKKGEQSAKAITDIYQKTMSVIGSIIQKQLSNVQNLISAQDQAIEKTQGLLDTELNKINEVEDAEAGHDTNKRKRLEQELKRQKDARQELLEQEIQLKRKQQKIAALQAGIDLASGIMSIWAQKGNFYVKLLQSIALGAIGAFQLANILSPSFAEGTDSVKGFGFPDGKDTVHARVDKGEMIVQKNLVKQLPKGFTRFMLPAAANMYMNGGSQTFVSDNRETNKYLKSIDKKVGQNKGFKQDGSLAWEKKGTSTIYYN